jgi:phosphoenolpyruvate carboxylase
MNFDATIPDDTLQDSPMHADIRLLGRVLGDTIRACEGEAAFALIEAIRQTALRFHRDRDPAARAELESALAGLSDATANRVVRAFSYFALLSNIAEDQQHLRSIRADRQGSTPPPGSLVHALPPGADAAELAAWFGGALVMPVLTAHPTEVQRKTVRTCQREIAALLDQRGRMNLTAEERTENEEALQRAVLRLWQARILRYARLQVRDEVANGIAHAEQTFLDELPRLYQRLEQRLGVAGLPPFLRLGSWIGGDRDGNPFVTAATLRETLQAQAAAVLDYYRTQLEHLFDELPLSTRLITVAPALATLSASSPDASPAPGGRTLPPRPAHHPGTPGGHRGPSGGPRRQRGERRRRCAALPRRRRPGGGPGGDPRLPHHPRLGPPRRRAAATAAAGGGGVRLPPRHPRRAAELRRA